MRNQIFLFLLLAAGGTQEALASVTAELRVAMTRAIEDGRCEKLPKLISEPLVDVDDRPSLQLSDSPTDYQDFRPAPGDIFMTYLGLAAKRGQYACAQILLTAGADATLGNMTPLTYAIERGDPDMVQLLIDFGGHTTGHNYISRASYPGPFKPNIDVLKALVAVKSPNEKARTNEYSPLHFLGYGQSVGTKDADEIVRLLTTHGANVNAVSKNGVTPLMMAAAFGAPAVADALIRSGAALDIDDPFGYTALMYARVHPNGTSHCGSIPKKPESLRARKERIANLLKQHGAVDKPIQGGKCGLVKHYQDWGAKCPGCDY